MGNTSKPKVLVVIPTRDRRFKRTMESVRNQTIKPENILIADKKFPMHLFVGERVSKAINWALEDVDLNEYTHLLRVDCDVIIPRNFLEGNLKLNSDIVGSSGYAQLIKMEPFLRITNGRYPEVPAEDSVLIADFVHLGLRVSKYSVTPILPMSKKYPSREWVERGRQRYCLGYPFLLVFADFRGRRQSTLVGFNVCYEILGYLSAYASRKQKYWFAEQRGMKLLSKKIFQKVFGRERQNLLT